MGQESLVEGKVEALTGMSVFRLPGQFLRDVLLGILACMFLGALAWMLFNGLYASAKLVALLMS